MVRTGSERDNVTGPNGKQLLELDFGGRAVPSRWTFRGERLARKDWRNRHGVLIGRSFLKTRVALAIASGVAVALAVGPGVASGVPNNPPNNPTAPAISYEVDCTTGFQAGLDQPFVTTLQGNTSIDSAAPTGQTFGFSGTATTVLTGAFIANIYENGLGSGTSQLRWTETIGSTDGHATGSYVFNSKTLSEPDGGGTTPRTVTWAKASTTLATTGGGFAGIAVGDGLASGQAGINQAATVTAVAANDDSITISLPTTAAATTGDAATVSWGATTVFSQAVNTGSIFTTNGPSGGRAGIGLVSATQFTAEELVTFGGATGDGPSNCLLTGWTGSTPPKAGPPQTGGTSPTGATHPALPAGSTTPLITASPVKVRPAAYLNLTAPTLPGAPTGVSASAGPINSTYATVSWTAPPDGGSPITSYVITTLQGGVNVGTTWVGPVTSGSVVGLATGVPYVFEVSAVNAVGTGPESSPSSALTLDAPPSITSAASTTFVKGQFSTFSVTATGYPTLMHFTKGGVLPSGVTLTGAGVLSGTPTATGSFTFAIEASNGVFPIASQAFTLKVVAIKITTLTLGTAKRGVPYSRQLTEVGGVAPFTWTNTTPKLPAGP